MSVYDKLHELKHTLVGDEHDSTTGAEDSGRQEEEHRESLSHKARAHHLKKTTRPHLSLF